MNPSPARRKSLSFVVCFLASLLIIRAAEPAAGTPLSFDRVAIPAVLLIEPTDSTPLDAQIRASQLRLGRAVSAGPEIERLGWLLVAKARASSDPGFYTLAGVAADTLERDYHLNNEAWLLRGHVLQTRHRFAEAEALGRKLLQSRGGAADYALLGDALYDEGRIGEAADAYQHMVDLKPSLDSYARAANIRWIKGDLAGAVALQTLAVRSGGPGDPGATAWSLVRLAQLVWQQGKAVDATTFVARALEVAPEFQPALLLQGRLLLSAGRAGEALGPLERAAAILPLPEPRWVFAEALRVVGRQKQAADLESLLVREGIAEDPRTVALFLATRGLDSASAVRLAADELKTRADVMTRSANALALAAAGRSEEAWVQGQAALAENTVDARLFLHAGRAAVLAGQPAAVDLLNRADRLGYLLLPSERKLLADSLALLPAGSRPTSDKFETTQQKSS